MGECTANIFLQFQGDQAGVAKGEQIPPSIIERPRIIKDETKRTVRIECKLRAKPDPQVKWFRDKQELTNGKKYKVEVKKEADNLFLLVLEILVRINFFVLSYQNQFDKYSINLKGFQSKWWWAL